MGVLRLKSLQQKRTDAKHPPSDSEDMHTATERNNSSLSWTLACHLQRRLGTIMYCLALVEAYTNIPSPNAEDLREGGKSRCQLSKSGWCRCELEPRKGHFSKKPFPQLGQLRGGSGTLLWAGPLLPGYTAHLSSVPTVPGRGVRHSWGEQFGFGRTGWLSSPHWAT